MGVAGAEVTGPLETVTAALDVIANADFDAVTLDIKLRGERSYSVADALAARNSPFVFLNGYGLPMFPPRHAKVVRLEKPVTPEVVRQTLETLLAAPSRVS